MMCILCCEHLASVSRDSITFWDTSTIWGQGGFQWELYKDSTKHAKYTGSEYRTSEQEGNAKPLPPKAVDLDLDKMFC